jgi:hypothetical protein
MALKPVYEKQDQIPQPLREHYVERDGKFVLQHDGEHPDSKVGDWRERNITLLKERDGLLKENGELKDKYKDIDPAVVAADRAKLADLERRKPDERVTALEAENATLKAEAARIKLRAALTAKAASAGVHNNAVEMAVNELEQDFVMEGDVVKAKPGLFSPDRPGEARTPEESLMLLSRSKDFLFKRSSGSGSGGDGSHAGGTGSSVRIIRNPSPAEIGKWASEVVAGRAKFEHDN